MSARLAARRRGDSMNTRVAGTPDSSARNRWRAALRGGGKPANRNRSVGSPETQSAAITADAPGSGITAIPSSPQARTSRYPGSEISGVPASETYATVPPSRSLSISAGPATRALWSWYGVSRALIPWIASSFDVTRVSSQATTSTRRRTSRARRVTSWA